MTVPMLTLDGGVAMDLLNLLTLLIPILAVALLANWLISDIRKAMSPAMRPISSPTS